MDIQQNIEYIREVCSFDFIKVTLAKTEIGEHSFNQTYASGNVSNRYVRIVLQKRIGLAGLVYKTGRPHYIVNAAKEITTDQIPQYPIILAEGLKSLGAVPLFDHDHVVGVVLAGFRTANQMTDKTKQQFEREVKRKFGKVFKERAVKYE